MKILINGVIFVLLAAGGTALLAGNAQAQLDMPKMESVQTIAWAIEFVTFVALMGVVWFVWRISKKDSENKKAKRDSSSDGSDY